MDLVRLKEIIDWMARSPVVELEISDGDFKVHLVRENGQQEQGGAAPAVPLETSDSSHEIVASSYGIIHLSPAPDSPAFVEVGQAVTAGQTVCVIEAMKVFTPIEAERAGTIAAILVKDGAEVSAGQVLFSLE